MSTPLAVRRSMRDRLISDNSDRRPSCWMNGICLVARGSGRMVASLSKRLLVLLVRGSTPVRLGIFEFRGSAGTLICFHLYLALAGDAEMWVEGGRERGEEMRKGVRDAYCALKDDALFACWR